MDRKLSHEAIVSVIIIGGDKPWQDLLLSRAILFISMLSREKKKKDKKSISSIEKQARKDEQCSLKQEKRKEKHRGHWTKKEMPLKNASPRFAIS